MGYSCRGIGYLNINATHVTANNSTKNNAVFFFVLDFRIEYLTTINPWSQCLGLERKNI